MKRSGAAGIVVHCHGGGRYGGCWHIIGCRGWHLNKWNNPATGVPDQGSRHQSTIGQHDGNCVVRFQGVVDGLPGVGVDGLIGVIVPGVGRVRPV